MRKVKRTLNDLEENSCEYFKLISKIRNLKLDEGEDTINVDEWTREENNKMQHCDNLMDDLDDYIKDQQNKEWQEISQREYKLEEDRRQKRMEDEDVRFERLRRLKLEDEEKKMKRQEAHEQKEKLLKLEITKFDSTIIDWVRFWEQFNEEIDKCKYYAPITKFFYLRELLTAQPKTEIAGLHFTDDGYRSAK
jgi:hypothetical protein